MRIGEETTITTVIQKRISPLSPTAPNLNLSKETCCQLHQTRQAHTFPFCNLGASWSFLRAQLAGIHEAKLTPATSKLEVLDSQISRIGTLGLWAVGLLSTAVKRLRTQVGVLKMRIPFSLVISTLPGPKYRYLLERDCSKMKGWVCSSV
jgi:hypothetical protein